MAPARDAQRQPRPAPRRRRDRQPSTSARKTGLTPLAEVGRHRRRHGASHGGEGLQAAQGRRALRARRRAQSAHASRRTGDAAIQAAGRRPGGRAAADAALRREARRLRAHQRRRRLPGQRPAARSSPRAKEELRARLEDLHRLPQLREDSSTTRCTARRSSASSSGRSSSRRSTVLLSFALGLFLAITLDKHGLRFQRCLPLGDHHPVRDPGLPRAARLGRPAERRLRRREQHLRTSGHVPWLFDANWARVSVHPRQRLADDAVLLPRLARRAAVDPGGADRGGAGRRRRRLGRSSGASRCRCCSSRSRRS